ncbi:hypothetical protein [Hyphomicrobium sp. ghe19]|uniref:hypothetical protein n=1 Tax=Hyphomicrobium sp. ghe19 TaxID=2682968 RepID=UPI0013668AE8|nr:hypothetical protein HYPP_01067 [Hyphomicrobium sp. ghe19]
MQTTPDCGIDDGRVQVATIPGVFRMPVGGLLAKRNIAMLNCRIGTLIVSLLASPAAAFAQENIPGHVTCDFDNGYAWTYDAGKYQAAPPKDLTFEIGSIDLEHQSASLILDGRTAASLKIVRAINANHFLEVVNEGFLNLTTIYDRDPATGKFPAVHSRHFGLFGQPVFAQYAGSCVPKP